MPRMKAKAKMRFLNTVADDRDQEVEAGHLKPDEYFETELVESQTGHSNPDDDSATQLIESPYSGGGLEENEGGDTLPLEITALLENTLPLENTALLESTLPLENTVLRETQLVGENKNQEKGQSLEDLHVYDNVVQTVGTEDTKTQLLEEFHEDNNPGGLTEFHQHSHLGGLTDRKGVNIIADSDDEGSGGTEVLSEYDGESDGRSSPHRTSEFKCGQFAREAVSARNYLRTEKSPQFHLSNTRNTVSFQGSSHCQSYPQFAVDSDASTEDKSDSDQPQTPGHLYPTSHAEGNNGCQRSAEGIFAHESRKATSKTELSQSAMNIGQMNNSRAFNKEPDSESDRNGHRSTEGLRSNGLDSPAAIGRVDVDRQVEINVTPPTITRATIDDSPTRSSMSTSGQRSIAAVRAASLRASGLRASGMLATVNEGTRGQARQNLLFSKDEVTEKHNSSALLIPGVSITIQGGSKTPTAEVSAQTEGASDKMGAISVVDKPLLKHMTLEVIAQNQADDRKEIENICGEVLLDSRQFTQFRSENLRARKLFSDATFVEDDKPRARDGNEGGDERKSKDGKEGDHGPSIVDFSEQDNEPRIRVDNEEFNKSRHNGEEDDKVKEAVSNIGSSMEFKPERLQEIGFGEKLQCPSVSTGLSYLNSQEPGEESQAAALNMVDKLLWLNTTGLSQDPEPAKLPEVTSTEPPSARGPQNLAQMVESRSPKENIGVFDWVDSQHDEGGRQFSKKNGRGVLASRRGGDTFKPEFKKIDCTSYRRKKGSSPYKTKNDKVGEDKSKILLRSLQKLSSFDASGSKLPQASDLSPGTENKVESNARRAQDALTKVVIQAEPADTLRYSKRLQLGKEKNVGKKVDSVAYKQNARDAELRLNSGTLSDQRLERSPSCGDSLGMSDIGSDTQLAAEAMQIMVCGVFSDEITTENTHKAEQQECANLKKARRKNGNLTGPVTSKESEACALIKKTLSAGNSENRRSCAKQMNTVTNSRSCAKRKNTVTSSVAADCEARGKSRRVHWAEDERKSQRKGEGRKLGRIAYSNEVGKQIIESQTNSRSSEAKEEKRGMLKDTVKVGRRKRKRAIAEDTSNLNISEGIDPSSKLAGFQSTGAAVEGALSKAGSALVRLTRRARTSSQVEKMIDSRSSQANEEMQKLVKDTAKVGRRTKKRANVEDTSCKLSNSKGTDHCSKSAGEVQLTSAAVEGMCLKASAGETCSARKAQNLEEDDKKKLDMQISLKISEAKGNEQDVSEDGVKIVRRPRGQGKMKDALCKMTIDQSLKLAGEVQPTGEAVEGAFLKGRKATVFSARQAKNLRQDENLKFETQAGLKGSENEDEKAEMLKDSVKTGRRKGKQANAKDNFSKRSNSKHIGHVSKEVGDVSSIGAAEEGTFLEVGETAVCLTRQSTHNAGPVVGSAACAFAGIDEDKSDLSEIVTEPGIQRRKSMRRSMLAHTPNWKTVPDASSLRDPAEDKVQFNITSVDAKSPQTPVNDISIKSPTSSGHGLGVTNSSMKALHKKGTPRSTLKRELDRLAATEACQSPILKDSVRRKREPGSVRVLFSHGLDDDIVKQQRKVLARLGGHVTTSPADCTHFVTDKFVRTRNMLEAMAAGKPVVTYLWLENCGQASYFIDEKKYILEDAKKEKEIGFSMSGSLASAQQRPLLQGRQVFVTQNTKPERESIVALVKAANGQVLDSCRGSFSKKGEKMENLIVISCEEDYGVCVPLLEKGAKVYSPELLLNGIVVQSLDFSRDQLFTDHVKRMRSSNIHLRQRCL